VAQLNRRGHKVILVFITKLGKSQWDSTIHQLFQVHKALYQANIVPIVVHAEKQKDLDKYFSTSGKRYKKLPLIDDSGKKFRKLFKLDEKLSLMDLFGRSGFSDGSGTLMAPSAFVIEDLEIKSSVIESKNIDFVKLSFLTDSIVRKPFLYNLNNGFPSDICETGDFDYTVPGMKSHSLNYNSSKASMVSSEISLLEIVQYPSVIVYFSIFCAKRGKLEYLFFYQHIVNQFLKATKERRVVLLEEILNTFFNSSSIYCMNEEADELTLKMLDGIYLVAKDKGSCDVNIFDVILEKLLTTLLKNLYYQFSQTDLFKEMLKVYDIEKSKKFKKKNLGDHNDSAVAVLSPGRH